MKRVATVTVGGLLLLSAVFALAPKAPDPGKIRHGDSEARVLELLGRPDETSGPPFCIRWGLNPIMVVHSGECVREFTYHRGRGDKSWHVGFDAHSNVISNYRWNFDREPTVKLP